MAQNKRAIAFRLAGLPARLAARSRVDPVSRSLENAPIDDEPLTPDDIEAIEEAKAEKGPFHSLEDVRAALAARRRA